MRDCERALTLDNNLFEAYNDRGALRLDLGESTERWPILTARYCSIRNCLKPLSPGLCFAPEERCLREAMSDFTRALELKPTLPWAHTARGTTFMVQGMMDPATKDFSASIELDPQFEVAYGNRGLALTIQGMEAEAQKDLKGTSSSSPTS